MNAPLRHAEVETGTGIAVNGATVTYRNGLTAIRDASFAIPLLLVY